MGNRWAQIISRECILRCFYYKYKMINVNKLSTIAVVETGCNNNYSSAASTSSTN